MTPETRVTDLLLRWEELRERGESVSVQELCKDVPDLAEELERRIRKLEALEPMLGMRPTLDSSSEVVGMETKSGPTREPETPRHREFAQIPGYEILCELGRGGMGVVYKARQLSLHRLVALKTIRGPEHAGDEELARFRVEAEAVARLQHPNIVQIHEIGEHDGAPFFSLEFVEGGDLDRLVASQQLKPRAAAEMIRTLARAVHYAHEHGIVHRDLKPSNVLLTADGVPKIADFGLAKRLDKGVTALTRTGAIIGTPCYMAPEQAAGKVQQIGPGTDIYSLGAMLYEMLTGRPPFQGETDMETIHQVIAQEPRPPRHWQPSLAADMETICLKCLEKQPARRYASAEALAEDLDCYLNGLSIVARPVRWWGRAWRWTLRHAAVVALAALAAFTLVCVLVITLLWQQVAPSAFVPLFSGPPIKVGILHSRSGTMASESTSIDASLLAIDEINKAGGVLGRKIVSVVADGKSDWPTYGREAERLISDEKVCTIFGCWTSASRKSVKEVVERHNHLLVYPMFSEGLEESPNIVYTGATANQQVIPAIEWSVDQLHKRRFFLVGSDYLWPHAVNAIIRGTVAELGAQIVGEEYVHLGNLEVSDLVPKIVAAKPDMILETIAGDSKVAFYRALSQHDIRSAAMPVMSFSSGGWETAALGKDLEGHYAAGSYFATIDSPENQRFVRRYRARYAQGQAYPLDDPVEASYYSVYLWAQAVKQADSDVPAAIRTAMRDQSLDAPEGLVRIDAETLHTWKMFRVARMLEDGRYHIVYTSPGPIRPVPYPPTRSRAAWDRFLDDLYRRWGDHWEKPAK